MSEKISKKAPGLTSIMDNLMIKTVLLQAALSLAAILASALIAYTSNIKRESYFYIVVLTLAAASFVSAFYAGKHNGKNGLVTGLVFCLPLNVTFCFISLILNSFKADATLAISIFILIIASMLGGILSVNTSPKKQKIGKRKGRRN